MYVINDYNSIGYTFNYITELNIMIIVKKMDMSYDFYIRHNMHAVERKLFMMINRDIL